jgi:hypothetical protein
MKKILILLLIAVILISATAVTFAWDGPDSPIVKPVTTSWEGPDSPIRMGWDGPDAVKPPTV